MQHRSGRKVRDMLKLSRQVAACELCNRHSAVHVRDYRQRSVRGKAAGAAEKSVAAALCRGRGRACSPPLEVWDVKRVCERGGDSVACHEARLGGRRWRCRRCGGCSALA